MLDIDLYIPLTWQEACCSTYEYTSWVYILIYFIYFLQIQFTRGSWSECWMQLIKYISYSRCRDHILMGDMADRCVKYTVLLMFETLYNTTVKEHPCAVKSHTSRSAVLDYILITRYIPPESTIPTAKGVRKRPEPPLAHVRSLPRQGNLRTSVSMDRWLIVAMLRSPHQEHTRGVFRVNIIICRIKRWSMRPLYFDVLTTLSYK